MEARHAKIDGKQREVPVGKSLEVDTRNLGGNGKGWPETSWLCPPTPATAGTPTVMLQRDGPDEKAEPLQEEDSEGEELSEEDLETIRRVFEGDEEVVAKSRVTAWLGEPCVPHIYVVERCNTNLSSQKPCWCKDKEGLYGAIRLERSKYIIFTENILWTTRVQRGDATGR
jgi:hypothetical protein